MQALVYFSHTHFQLKRDTFTADAGKPPIMDNTGILNLPQDQHFPN